MLELSLKIHPEDYRISLNYKQVYLVVAILVSPWYQIEEGCH